ncbi:MAG: START domain-containing protein [Bacteroidetes bacterium]|nr:START domain-containing protein [Bacteroidota bacterium]
MNPKMLFILILSIITTLFHRDSDPDNPEWELAKEEDGIKVYTRYIKDSEIRAFRAEALMEGKLSAFVSVFKDVENFPKLFSNNQYSSIIEMQDTIQWHYVITNVPWPLSDRDGIYTYSYKQNYQNKVVMINIAADPDRLPENEGLIRIRKVTGQWIFEPVDVNKVMVTLELHAEPGGSIPGWIANMFIVDSPVKDFKRLRERVQLDQYKDKKYDFLVEY